MPEHATATRPRTAPLHPRRISGPARRPVPAGAPVRGRTGAFERLSRIPDHRVVDRLLRSRACIWMIGIMLGGIVAMQVSLLRLNTGISRAVATQGTLESQNTMLQAQIAELSSGERIRATAAARGMVAPRAGDTRFVLARPGRDAARAARRMKPPSPQAQQVMANHGLLLPGVVATSTATIAGAGAATTVAATPTPMPAAAAATPTPAAAVTGIPTPAPTATPVPTVTTAPATGAAVAPQG